MGFWRKFFSVFLLVEVGWSQWNFYLDTYATHDQNLIRNFTQLPDQIVAPQIGLSFLMPRFEAYYQVDLTRMINNGQYNNSLHQAGIDFFREQSTVSHYYGIALATRQYTIDYEAWNFWKGFAYYQIKLVPAEWTGITSGISLTSKTFRLEPSWNHAEIRVFVQHNIFLPTRSTLRWEIDYLRRDFLPYRNALNDNRTELPALWQLVAILRWAQSFGDKLGGYSEVQHRYNPSPGNPYQLDLVSFSPIDDYFGYKGWTLSNVLKWKIQKVLWAKMQFTSYRNIYLNRPVYAYDFTNRTWLTDTNGELLVLKDNRVDRGTLLELSLGYDLDNLFSKASQLGLEAFGNLYQNHSNDQYFEYSDHALGLRINYELQW